MSKFNLFSAGLACALVSFPISMTYGVIAFSPFGAELVSYGITAGLFGAIVSSFLLLLSGARTSLGAGPRAASVVIFAALCSQLLADNNFLHGEQHRTLAILAVGYLAFFLAGLIQVGVGLSRTGMIVKFIPYPVVAGFINATAILIVVSQIWPLLGLDKQAHGTDVFENIVWLALVPGVGAILFMYLAQVFKVPVSGVLVGLLAGTVLHHGLLLQWPGAEVGNTLQALDGWIPLTPLLSLDAFETLWSGIGLWNILLLVFPAALSMAVISSFDTIFSITAMDEITEKRTDANRELSAHGFANVGSAIFGGLNSSGGLNRTKPALDAGITDAMVHPVTGLFMLLAVVFLSDWFVYMPLSVISGVMIFVCLSLADRWVFSAFVDVVKGRTASRWGTSMDIAIILLVIVVALAFNLMIAVLVGTLFSVILFAAKVSHSPVKSVAHGASLHSLKVWDVKRQSILDKHSGKIALIKFQGAIFFGTSDALERKLEELLDEGILYFVLDFKSVTDIDISGTRALLRFNKKIVRAKGLLAFSYIKKERRVDNKKSIVVDRRKNNDMRRIWKTMLSARVVETVGEANFVFDSDSGLARCEACLIERYEDDFPVSHSTLHRHKNLLHHLSLKDFRVLRGCIVKKEYNLGEIIFEQGNKEDCAYFLARGSVDIRLKMEEGDDTKLLQSLMPGSVFGEMALLDSVHRSASAISTEITTCYVLNLDDFRQLQLNEPDIVFKMVNWVCLMFSDRLRNANSMILELEE